MAMEPGTIETKPKSERVLIQPTREPSAYSHESRLSCPKTSLHRDGQEPLANRERAAGRNKHEPLKCSSKDEDEDEQLSIDESLESDEETPTDGWLGNEDQMADLVLVLRWAQAYRVSVEGAGRMLRMKPEIVNRAVEVHAQSTSEGDPNAREGVVGRRTRPVIKHWVRLGPLRDFVC